MATQQLFHLQHGNRATPTLQCGNTTMQQIFGAVNQSMCVAPLLLFRVYRKSISVMHRDVAGHWASSSHCCDVIVRNLERSSKENVHYNWTTKFPLLTVVWGLCSAPFAWSQRYKTRADFRLLCSHVQDVLGFRYQFSKMIGIANFCSDSYKRLRVYDRRFHPDQGWHFLTEEGQENPRVCFPLDSK